MSNPFFDHPILNSPYECPRRHWELDTDGQRVRNDRDAVWNWVIGPKLKGQHRLLLTVTSNVGDNASIEPLVRVIQVTAAEGESADLATGFVKA